MGSFFSYRKSPRNSFRGDVGLTGISAKAIEFQSAPRNYFRGDTESIPIQFPDDNVSIRAPELLPGRSATTVANSTAYFVSIRAPELLPGRCVLVARAVLDKWVSIRAPELLPGRLRRQHVSIGEIEFQSAPRNYFRGDLFEPCIAHHCTKFQSAPRNYFRGDKCGRGWCYC